MPDDENVGGLRRTAEYFETRARRARNDADHEHHLIAAWFYRELAAITLATARLRYPALARPVLTQQ